MPSIRWNEHSAYLTNSVSELYRNSEFTDCILDIEGVSIQVHKTVLAACSPYFKKLLKDHHAITFIPIIDVKYKDLKLILDFIYYGEIDVLDIDVASLMKTAELMEMTSLQHSVSHRFEEEFSCIDTSVVNLNDRCSVSCTNLIRNDTKKMLKEQVSHDSTILYMREDRLNSKSQNIHLQSVSDSTTKCLNDFQDLSEKLNKDQPKGSVLNTCHSFKEMTKENEENVNNELFPLTFVAVPPVSVKNEPIEEHQDDMRCFDLVLKDPLREYSGILDVINERNVQEECPFQSELQVKREPKEQIYVPESIVLIADKLTNSCNELTNTESNQFVACKQEKDMESNPDVICSNTFCSEGCAAGETQDLEIKFESICEISGVDVKEEQISETSQCLNHSIGDDTGTPSLECESELLKSGAQHFRTIDYQQDANEEIPDASLSQISTPFLFKIGNETPAIYRSTFTQIKLSNERMEFMERTGSNSSHIASLNVKKQCNNQHLVPRDSFYLDPSRGGHGLTGKMQTHSIKRKTYSCVRCRKSFIRKDHHDGHMRIHTGEKPFKCITCQSSFSVKSTLLTHMRTHSREKPFLCAICEKSFNQKGHLTEHIRKHTGEKPFQCEICKSSFSVKSTLKNHIRTHTGEKPFKCVFCISSFSEGGNLRKHMRTHTGEKPFQCGVCNNLFNQKYHLTEHMRKHTGEKPYQCEVCKFSFSLKSTLTEHIRTHTGQKPFQCQICEKSFSQKSHLTGHMRKHTGDKPYHCEICNSSFSVKSSLNKHMRTHNGENRTNVKFVKSRLLKKVIS